MSFLTNQVVLTEEGFDVIAASKSNTTIKGQDSSVITVSLEESLNQDLDYTGLVVIGGDNLTNWELLQNTLMNFHNNDKPMGFLQEGVDIAQDLQLTDQLSQTSEIHTDNNIISMKEAGDIELFVSKYIELIRG